MLWCFSWFNYPENWHELFEAKQGYLKGWVGGHEICPKTGRPHIQGAIEFVKKNRPDVLNLDNKIHWEVARAGKTRNYEYTTKDGCWKGWGTFLRCKPYRLELPELRPWQNEVLKILRTEPDNRSIYWLWCEEGGSGKTTFIKHFLSCYPELRGIVSGGKAADVQNQVVEMLENQGFLPRTILYNIPRSFRQEYLCWHAIESLKDMCFYSGKYKGGMINGECPHVVIFANSEPDKGALSEDRWKVAKIVDHALVWGWKTVDQELWGR